MVKKHILIIISFLIFASAGSAQTTYKYETQKKFIPKELGKVYLGMPFDEFAKVIDLKTAELGDTRFQWLELKIPIANGPVTRLTVRIYGLSEDDKKSLVKTETVTTKEVDGFEFKKEVEKLVIEKISNKGFISEMYVNFKPDFDQKAYVIKTFGKDGDVRAADDPYRFYDIQWEKKTSDGLGVLVRSFHEDEMRSLHLLGRIPGTEWGDEEP